MSRYTHENTPGYTDAGLRALNRAHDILVAEHGLDMATLPDAVAAEIDTSLRERLTNTHRKNLPVRDLLRVAA